MVHFSPEEQRALKAGDHVFINMKGADAYIAQDYKKAIAFYHLASSLGDVNALSNLGYCYLYGRSVAVDIDLALAYFGLAAQRGSVDALYKLGDIYSRDKWGHKNVKWSLAYYTKAINRVLELEGVAKLDVANSQQLLQYPSLCLALGQAYLEGLVLPQELKLAKQLLLKAKQGYEWLLRDGQAMYGKSYQHTKELLEDSLLQGL